MAKNKKSKSKAKSQSRVKAKRVSNPTLKLWLGRIVVLTGLIVGFGWFGAWFFLGEMDRQLVNWSRETFYDVSADAGFVVEEIIVEGVVNADVQMMKAIINIERGDPLFALNPREAKDLVEMISWVKNARVERRFPDTIYIKVDEREPMAFWQKGGKLKLLDRDGEVIVSEDMARFEDLMIVVGDDAPEKTPDLVALLEEFPDLYKHIYSASWIGDRRWNLKMGLQKIEVKLPESDVFEALERLQEVHVREDILNKILASIDLREAGQVIVRTKPGDVQNYSTGGSQDKAGKGSKI